MNDLLGIVILALCTVESNGNPTAIGDNGQAVGILQIHKEVIRDVNRILRKQVYTLSDRTDPAKSKAIARVYLMHYCTRERLGRAATAEDYAKIWNGGPDGYKKAATDGYWRKVKKILLTSKSGPV